jgi:hypothetical protein
MIKKIDDDGYYILTVPVSQEKYMKLDNGEMMTLNHLMTTLNKLGLATELPQKTLSNQVDHETNYRADVKDYCILC